MSVFKECKDCKKYKFLKYLIYFCRANQEDVVSTAMLSEEFGVSQQTVSRILREMESEGLISRRIVSEGQVVTVTDNGIAFLRKIEGVLKSVLDEKPKKIVFSGVVEKGSGEGSYYIQQEGYERQFKKLLGYVPYPGTLNVKLSKDCLGKRGLLESFNSIMVSGFRNTKREFGRLLCFPCLINGKIRGHLIVPERAHHEENVLELISEKNLMKTLNIDYDDKIKVEVWQS